MLFNCAESATAAKLERGTESTVLTVDIHCHAHVPAADDIARPGLDVLKEPMLRFPAQRTRDVNVRQMAGLHPKLTTVDARIRDMDAAGIDVQVISPSPFQYFYGLEADLGLEAARSVNDGIAELVAQDPSRFVGLATVPLQEPALAVSEVRRLVREHGIRGVEVSTNVNGVELSDSRHRPFFAAIEELDLLLFLHPNGFTHGDRLANHYFINTIGNPLDTTIALGHLIFDGVLDDYPRLKICVAHGGGYLASYAARMDHAYHAREDCREHISRPPSEILKQLYFDTVVFSREQLEHLVAVYGPEHLIMGTDYPYDMAEEDPVGFVLSAANLSSEGRRAILGGNALRLLRLN